MKIKQNVRLFIGGRSIVRTLFTLSDGEQRLIVRGRQYDADSRHALPEYPARRRPGTVYHSCMYDWWYQVNDHDQAQVREDLGPSCLHSN